MTMSNERSYYTKYLLTLSDQAPRKIKQLPTTGSVAPLEGTPAADMSPSPLAPCGNTAVPAGRPRNSVTVGATP